MAKVLIVDDDPLLRRALERELRRTFEVTVAGSFEEAVAQLQGGATPDVVLTDLDMPPGPGGLDLLDEVRTRRPACGRVLMSGSATQIDIDRALADGVIHVFLAKPWQPGGPSAALQQALAQTGSTS